MGLKYDLKASEWQRPNCLILESERFWECVKVTPPMRKLWEVYNDESSHIMEMKLSSILLNCLFVTGVQSLLINKGPVIDDACTGHISFIVNGMSVIVKGETECL